MNVAQQIVTTLEKRGVQFAFGVPGEENISLVTELEKSDKIRFITCSDEQAATFMAGMIGWQSPQPALSIATLGPGALNMSVALGDAHTHSFPLIAIAAQGPLESLYKETKQVVDLKTVFTPLTKFSDYLYKPDKTSEVFNKAYNDATNKRPGAVFIGVPSDFEREDAGDQKTVITNPTPLSVPTNQSIDAAVSLLEESKKPIVIAGLGANREEVGKELMQLVEEHQLPIATTYMAKGIVSENHPNSLGIIGFLVEDYIERILKEYDLIITVGFDFSELDPDRLNPQQDKKIIHIHSYEQDTHKNYSISSNLIGKLDETLTKFTDALKDYKGPEIKNSIQPKLREQLQRGAESSEDGPLTPIQIIHATKEVLTDEDKVFVDTGALKMWMARLYPAVNLNQVKVNNAMSSMAWSIPGTIAAKLINPNQRILTMTGDGSFNMNSQELALAKKLNIPMTIVIWDDSGYELINWKMEMTIDESAGVEFKNPDFVKLAEAYGGKGYVADNRDHYEQLLRESFDKQDGIDIIVAPVDYSKNYDLSDYLAELE